MTFHGFDPDDLLLRRIRSEFLEMPGLCLTLAQAARLWNLDLGQSEAALQALMQDGFLTQTEDGRFMAAQYMTRRIDQPSSLAR